MLKILQVRLRSKLSKTGFISTWTKNSQIFKLDLEKAEEQEITLLTSSGSWKNQEDSRKKKIYFCFIDNAKVFDCVDITTDCGKFLKRWQYQTTLLASWEICIQVREQQLETDMEQLTGPKLGKEYIKDVYCHPAYLTYMQSTLCKMLGGWSTSWDQDCCEKHQ